MAQYNFETGRGYQLAPQIRSDGLAAQGVASLMRNKRESKAENQLQAEKEQYGRDLQQAQVASSMLHQDDPELIMQSFQALSGISDEDDMPAINQLQQYFDNGDFEGGKSYAANMLSGSQFKGFVPAKYMQSQGKQGRIIPAVNDKGDAVYFQQGADGQMQEIQGYTPPNQANADIKYQTWLKQQQAAGGIEAENINQTTEAKADQASKIEQAKQQAAAGSKRAEATYDKAQGITAQVGKIDKAIDALEKGAKSGVIQRRLPSFSQSTIQLEEAAKELGIEVINSATFGALSEKELGLALDTALPMNLDEKELLPYLREKKAAMLKIQVEMKKLGKHLSDGNNMSDWYELQDSQYGGDKSASASITTQDIDSMSEAELDAFLGGK